MKWLLILASLIISAILIYILQHGIAPRYVGVMKPSVFERVEQVGAVTYLRFYDPLGRTSRVTFVLPADGRAAAIVLGFLQAAEHEKRAYTQVIVEPAFLPFFTSVPQAQAYQNHQALPTEGLSLILITPETLQKDESTWLQSSFLIRHELLPLALPKEQLQDPVCDKILNFHCAALRHARKALSKKLDTSRVVAALDRVNLGEHVLYMYYP